MSYGFVVRWKGSRPEKDMWLANIYFLGGKDSESRTHKLDNSQVYETKDKAEKRIKKILAVRPRTCRDDFEILPVGLKIEEAKNEATI